MAFPHIDTPSGGLLTTADLDAARRESTGRIYQFARHCPPCDGLCRQGRDCVAESCAAEGGTYHEPSATIQRPALGLALVLLAWPAVAAVVGAVAWVLR